MKEDQFSWQEYFAKHNIRPETTDHVLNNLYIRQYDATAKSNSQKKCLSDYNLDFKNDEFNMQLLKSFQHQVSNKLRKEQFLPPIRFWTKSFIIC